MIEFISNHADASRFLSGDYENWLVRLCEVEGKQLGEVGVHLVNDDELLKINRDFLNHDYLTDIITFDRCYNQIVTGELWISLDRVINNAQELKVGVQEEFYRVLAHGVLHLIGYKDKSSEEAELMREKEAEALILRKRY